MGKFVILVLILILLAGPLAFVSANGGGDATGTGTPHQTATATTPTTSPTGATGTGTPHQTATATTPTTSPTGATGTVTGISAEDDHGRSDREDDSGGTEVTNLQVNVKETNGDESTDATVLKVKIKEKVNETESEIHSSGVKDEQVIRNQTTLLIGVEALQLVDELVADYGTNISGIKSGLEDSINATTQAEIHIKDRNRVVRFFTGGDDVAARQIERELDQNQDRIQEMQQLIDQCNCSTEVKDVLHDQIREMEQEQDRLRDLAQQELEDTGLIGWIWK